MPKRGPIIPILVVLCLLMTAANAWLIHQNRTLRAGTWSKVKAGTKVASLSGIDLSGRQIQISPNAERYTVLLVYSPVCPYCAKNWPKWTYIIRNSAPDITFITADLTDTAKVDFIRPKVADTTVNLKRLDPRQVVDLQLNMTPETIVINREAHVVKSWVGELNDNDFKEIQKLLT